MKSATLTRSASTDQGTFGVFKMDDGSGVWNSGELPWHDNQTGVSCIPPGTYVANPIVSPKHGPCFMLTGVPGRADVEIHAANWMGDQSLGYKCQLLGCIALGKAQGVLEGQEAVLLSQDALKEFLTIMGGDSLSLTIKDAS